MTTEQAMTLVLKDAAGEYYVVPLATLEQGRVPEEQKAQIEQLLSAQQDDVQGHLVVPVVIVAIELGVLIGIGVADATSGEPGLGALGQDWADQGKALSRISGTLGRRPQ